MDGPELPVSGASVPGECGGRVKPDSNGRIDAGTNDFLTGLMEKHAKMAWMLRAFLEAKS